MSFSSNFRHFCVFFLSDALQENIENTTPFTRCSHVDENEVTLERAAVAIVIA